MCVLVLYAVLVIIWSEGVTKESKPAAFLDSFLIKNLIYFR